MKPILIWAIILILVVSGTDARAGDQKYRVSDCEVRDLVGDIVARPDSLGKQFVKILGRKAFLRYAGTKEPSPEFDSNGFYWVRNPLAASVGHDGEWSEIEIVLEIENVYYGQNKENLSDVLIMIWLLGPLLTSLDSSGSDAIVGLVQYRATARCSSFPNPVVGVGQGAVVGNIEGLSRFDAITLSADRALEDTAFELMSNINKQWRFDAGNGFDFAEWEQYQEKAAALVKNNGE